jgi:L-ribulose-5-phosphate 3-epimerase
MKIGVMVESFRLGWFEGLKAAAQVGADGVQIYATTGDTHFSKLVGPRRAQLKTALADHGLVISALCADFGGHGFQIEAENSKRIEDSKRVMELGLELGTRVVTTHIGVIPAQRAHPRHAVLARACEKLGAFGDSIGATFAIETGPEPAAVLAAFLADIGLPKGIGVNFDPANLKMVLSENIPQAVATLAPYIVHTHAKDGLNLKPFEAELLYNPPADNQGVPANWGDYFREVPLGEGQVDFPVYLAAIKKAKLQNLFFTIEREVGTDPVNDIRKAVDFLRQNAGLLN